MLFVQLILSAKSNQHDPPKCKMDGINKMEQLRNIPGHALKWSRRHFSRQTADQNVTWNEQGICFHSFLSFNVTKDLIWCHTKEKNVMDTVEAEIQSVSGYLNQLTDDARQTEG